MRFILVFCFLCFGFSALSLASDEAPGSSDFEQHALVQKKTGFYGVLLPPDYGDPKNKDQHYPLCLMLHGSGASEEAWAPLADALGRDGVIYLIPRAAHLHRGYLLQNGKTGYTAWPNFPSSWGEYTDPDFPKDKIAHINEREHYTDWIADCLADAKSKYRIDEQKVVIVGHSQGAHFAREFTMAHPEKVRAYFAYAGYFERPQHPEEAELLKSHNIVPYIVHHRGDAKCSVEDSIKLCQKFKDNQVKHQAMIYDEGNHDISHRVLYEMKAFVNLWCRGQETGAYVEVPLRGVVMVSMVIADSKAEQAGIQEGDVILSYDDQKIKQTSDIVAAIKASATKEEVAIELEREGESFVVKVSPGRLGVQVQER